MKSPYIFYLTESTRPQAWKTLLEVTLNTFLDFILIFGLSLLQRETISRLGAISVSLIPHGKIPDVMGKLPPTPDQGDLVVIHCALIGITVLKITNLLEAVVRYGW